MSPATTNVAVLGSTGSIGRSALAVISASQGRLRAVGLSAHSRLAELHSQAVEFGPDWIVATDQEAANRFDWWLNGSKARVFTDATGEDPRSNTLFGGEIHIGAESLETAVQRPEVDIVLLAIVGSAGLRTAWAALEAKKTLALANKETLVVAGALIMDLARRQEARILPVDSEHSAIFQCLQAGRREEVRRVILTASGGPFLKRRLEDLESVRPEEALAHPTWDMGPKITIDSATMMNKALEIIEARWLFDLPVDRIAVMIHPQSIVHSFVEFQDGSVVAQMSPPDMKLPIQYALCYPHRTPGVATPMDWSRASRLDFEPPDLERFPALELGFEAARAGGTTGAVLNAANEAAVAAYLSGELKFTEIVPACRAVLRNHEFDPRPSLERLFEADRWARREVLSWACT